MIQNVYFDAFTKRLLLTPCAMLTKQYNYIEQSRKGSILVSYNIIITHYTSVTRRWQQTFNVIFITLLGKFITSKNEGQNITHNLWLLMYV